MTDINSMTIATIAERCIGHIDAIGESNYDKQSYENLKSHCDVIDILLDDIQFLLPYMDSCEGSVHLIGCRAFGYLAELRGKIDDWIEEVVERNIRHASPHSKP